MTDHTIKPEERWTEWSGGECPVARDVLVQAQLRTECVTAAKRRSGLKADAYRWDHRNRRSDVIAYRIVESTQ